MAKTRQVQRSKAARKRELREQRRREAQRRKRIVIGVGSVVVAALVVVLVLAVVDETSADGVTDAENFDLPALDGDGRVQLADFEGTPTVVNFFASWCTACDAELPEYRETALALEGDVDFVFVNSNETGDWRPMAERNDILQFPLAQDTGGTRGNGLYRSLRGTGGMPITAFYDADGELVDTAFGALVGGQLPLRLQQLGLASADDLGGHGQ